MVNEHKKFKNLKSNDGHLKVALNSIRKGLSESKYFIINPIVNYSIGMITGYSLEKNKIPYSNLDNVLQFAVPTAIGSLECLIEKHVKHQDKINKSEIIPSNLMGIIMFYSGNRLGRFLAYII